MRRLLALIAGALVLAGCASAPGEGRRAELTRRIADDAAAFNEAYGQAVAGQLLLNILRGRDRLPRYYLAMTGISDAPSESFERSYAIGSVPLGTGTAPRGFGGVSVSRESQSRPSYAVQPFNAETLTRTAFQPIAPHIFAHYWASGWPRDLLLFVLVDRIEVRTPEGAVTFNNEANNIFNDCAPEVTTSGCDYVRAARAMLRAIEARPIQDFSAQSAILCGLVEAYGAEPRVRPGPADADCPPRIVVDDTIYAFTLRSMDDAIYYVGELLRAASMEAGDGPIEAPLNVAAAGLRGGGAGVPLFRVVPDARARAPIYAASVTYAGARLHAGPAIGRSCAAPAADGACRDDAEHGDRSSSVLSLLAEFMALNQSPDAIRAPNRLIVE